MTEPLILPIDGWKLEVVKRHGGELQIAIVTDDRPSASHYVRLGPIGAAALRDYLIQEVT